ncbi:hypothetical protein [Paractinoplanes lichenicola]|uniref:Uncharacterized protein n=1 Tax=Paractinoplanes lichenicola TaxID=2802976 RepID=A0ABS1VMN1_9ACTN|nr:hypothetical protein [Actinoplanes lichenicola]MBL7255741.1 hypothetical protein [Actinoplanes lichenicola]
MRIGRRRLVAAGAGLLLVVVLAVAAIALVRWRAAGESRAIAPPAGATTPPGYERDVADRATLIARGLRNERGEATVRTYAMPAGSPWLQSRQLVATQLDHWEQVGDCADNPAATIVECAWREPTRWWPREVRLTMMRLDPGTFVIVGSGVGD